MTRGHARISKQNNSSSQKNRLFHNQLLPITHRPLARLPWVNIIKAPGKEGRAPQGDDTRVKSTGRRARTQRQAHKYLRPRCSSWPPFITSFLPRFRRSFRRSPSLAPHRAPRLRRNAIHKLCSGRRARAQRNRAAHARRQAFVSAFAAR